MSDRNYFPALRGRFGDWAYYATLMKLEQVASRIDYAKDIHSSQSLSELIQRELREGRAKEICEYLQKNDDRFFNSLVVAIYGGSPGWHELDVSGFGEDIDPEDLDDTALHSVGYLSLTKSEQIFALDGQHRLAGIQQALEANSDLGTEELSVIFVAHHNTTEGMQRTRKLFTTLNKQAKPVKKSEIIALDESDAMAIAARHLVENHKYFNAGQIDTLRKQANLPNADYKHFTTIINLYDVLCTVIPFVKERMKGEDAQKLKLYRPSDSKLDEYLKFSEKFFEDLAKSFPRLQEYFSATDKTSILKQVRTDEGGHILFRPIGISIFSDVLKELRASLSYSEAMKKIRGLPVNLNEAPYVNTVWNPHRQTIDTRRAALCRDILLYMLGRGKNVDRLKARYASVLEMDESEVVLPGKI